MNCGNKINHLDKFALEIDVINKSYAQPVTTEPTPETTRNPFSDEKINTLWGNGANKKCIDLLMGHKSNDVGERVYTHKTLDELREAIQ